MTNTADLHKRAVVQPDPTSPQHLSRQTGISLVEQIVQTVTARIDDKRLRAGARMPSIRQYAEANGVSRFTVVEAYDRLVASGYLESRRGSGFYVRERSPLANTAPSNPSPDQPSRLDIVWLIRNMFRQTPSQSVPGSGLLPNDWLDSELIGNALRAVSRQQQSVLLQYGTPQGFLPLRQQLQLKLAELEISASPEQIITTTGITQALDLVARHFLQPGDTVFVDDPAWYLMFGSFSMLGAKVVGIPRLQDGPDMARLAELAALHKPKLFVINSVLHNPTSTSLSAAKAFQILKIAEEHDFIVVEDDIYCDLHPGTTIQHATRIAPLDGLNRVIYLGGFSKTLAANLRVGFIAASHEHARHLADRKILSTMTSSELGERVVHKILTEGHYRKHTDRLRTRLAAAREKVSLQLEKIGMRAAAHSPAGMFIWADAGCDTALLTERALEHNCLLAPGSLFSPSQLPSTHLRLNVAMLSDPAILPLLEREISRLGQAGRDGIVGLHGKP
ncbi:PLP-dependent aminotransferase family protein [Oxalobacteraceae bacterium R-40]|uniref:PLP-dependent aminotransferase family protein n=1 Tax=Keguizhuia sedimenti TaxID=3064264 RepID=A0ABU1BN74_9BURK|nr:PLP-dependent aminotransferase family protein [Oxalobacteraceae bacterium R-40]